MHYGTNFNQVYFFLQIIFPVVSWISKYGIYKFSCKNSKIVLCSKLLASRTLGHFRKKNNKVLLFSFRRFYQMFLRRLNMLPTSFHAKMPKFYFVQIFRPVGPRDIFEQILLVCFFFLQNFFPIVSWTSKYRIYKFSCKIAKIVFWSKFLARRT